jgi:hypothetical protein
MNSNKFECFDSMVSTQNFSQTPKFSARLEMQKKLIFVLSPDQSIALLTGRVRYSKLYPLQTDCEFARV